MPCSPPSATRWRKSRRLLFDQPQACRKVAERKVEVADIGEVEPRRIDPELRMLAVDQHAAGTADGLRAVARAGPVGGADVERDAGDNELGVAVVPPGEPRKPGGVANVGGPAICETPEAPILYRLGSPVRFVCTTA